MLSFVAESPEQAVSFDQNLLIIPAVAIGNVGQLAVDLLVTSMDLPRIGFLDSEYVLPIVGYDWSSEKPAESHRRLVLNFEVFQDPERKITVIQQRAPAIKGRTAEFSLAIMQWIADRKFSEVLLLSSLDASRRIDSQLSGIQTRYLSTARSSSLLQRISEVHVPPLEHAALCIEEAASQGVLEKRDEQRPDFLPVGPDCDFLRNSSTSRLLYDAAVFTKVPLVLLTEFCMEGNNIPDALRLVDVVNNLLQLVPVSRKGSLGCWTHPVSWDTLLNDPYDRTLYT